MKRSLPPTTDPSSILAYRDRQIAVELLAVAICHLDFFDWVDLEEGATTEEICSHYGFVERPVDVLLTLCRANGYIETDPNGIHHITQMAKEHLVSNSPWYLGPYFAPMKESSFVEDFLQILKSGKPANWKSEDDGADWHDSMLSEEFAKSFTELMDCRGLAFAQVLTERLGDQLKHRNRVLDVGGGSGVYAAAMVSAHSNLTGVVLEQSPVDDIARGIVAKRGLAERIGVVSGDMFTDDWPKDCDVHLLSNLLHDWDFPEIEKIIAQSAKSIPEQGLLIIHQALLADDKAGPIEAAEYSTLLMHITQGKCYSRAELIPILEKHGFVPGESGDTLAGRGYLTAVRGK